MPVPQSSDRIKDLINRIIAAEMQSVIQYMWQHVMIIGTEAETIGGALRSTAMSEMKHAETWAERLNYLGGIPTTKPDPIYVGGSTAAMLNLDIKAEEDAIALYTELMQAAHDEDDHATALMAKESLIDEQEHHNTFLTLAGKKPDLGEPRIGD